jgi:hyperosmotically inducible protein
MKKLTLAGLVGIPAFLLIGVQGVAQTAPTAAATHSVAPDNTKSNQVNPSDHDATADKQRNDATDLDLVKRIRKSVLADSNLSTYGHNVKIVAVNGTVTLNGVVRSAEEKAQISTKATTIAGEGHVVDDLKVAPK